VFSFVVPYRPYAPCSSRDDFHLRGQSGHGSIFPSAQVYKVISGAFDASWFQVAVVFGVPVFLAICTLGNVSFVSEEGGVEFYFALLYAFDIEYILLFGAGKNMENGSLALFCLMFQIFLTDCFI
jgi:hypothetical protein